MWLFKVWWYNIWALYHTMRSISSSFTKTLSGRDHCATGVPTCLLPSMSLRVLNRSTWTAPRCVDAERAPKQQDMEISRGVIFFTFQLHLINISLTFSVVLLFFALFNLNIRGVIMVKDAARTYLVRWSVKYEFIKQTFKFPITDTSSFKKNSLS